MAHCGLDCFRFVLSVCLCSSVWPKSSFRKWFTVSSCYGRDPLTCIILVSLSQQLATVAFWQDSITRHSTLIGGLCRSQYYFYSCSCETVAAKCTFAAASASTDCSWKWALGHSNFTEVKRRSCFSAANELCSNRTASGFCSCKRTDLRLWHHRSPLWLQQWRAVLLDVAKLPPICSFAKVMLLLWSACLRLRVSAWWLVDILRSQGELDHDSELVHYLHHPDNQPPFFHSEPTTF